MSKRTHKAKRLIAKSYEDPAVGIDSTELAEIVGAVLSHILFAYKDNAGGLLSHIHRFLRLYANTEIARGRSASPAPNPKIGLDVQGWSRSTARRRLNVTPEDELDLYQAEYRLEGAVARLPAEFVSEYLPLELWLVLASIVDDGPVLFERRLDTLLFAERERKLTKPTRRRPEGGYVSYATLWQLYTVARRIACALRQQASDPRHKDEPRLSEWKGFFVTIDCPASKAGEGTVTDNSAPPTHLVRLAYLRMDEEIRAKLNLAETDDELQVIKGAPFGRISGLFTKLRNRAIFVCFATLGARIEELLGTCRGDFVFDYRFLGGITPALYLAHPKTEEPAGFHPMPREAGLAIEAYIAFLDRAAEASGATPYKDRDPLFLGSMKTRTPINRAAVESWFGGSADERRAPAVMPMSVDDPSLGYRPHGMRKRLKLWCSSIEAEEWCRENGVEPARQEAIGEACLAHSLSEIAALYRGDTTPEGKEQLRYWGAAIAWEMLVGNRGARKIPDAEAYRRNLREGKARRESLANLEKEIEELCTEAERTGHEVNPTIVLGRMQRAIRWARELAEIDKTLIEIEAGVPELLRNVDDQVPDDEVPDVDLKRIREEVMQGIDPTLPGRLRPVRNWLTPDELALIIGKGPSTVRAWITKGLPQTLDIWDAEHPPIRAFSKNRRVILADGINSQTLDSPEKREALAELLAQDPPSGWAHLPLLTGPE